MYLYTKRSDHFTWKCRWLVLFTIEKFSSIVFPILIHSSELYLFDSRQSDTSNVHQTPLFMFTINDFFVSFMWCYKGAEKVLIFNCQTNIRRLDNDCCARSVHGIRAKWFLLAPIYTRTSVIYVQSEGLRPFQTEDRDIVIWLFIFIFFFKSHACYAW